MDDRSSAGGASRLTVKHLVGYACGDLGGCMTFAILGSFLTPYYTEIAGISMRAVTIMYLILKIWDAVNDPMMGALMDKVFARTHSKKGKFLPWMFRAAPLLFITSVAMYTAPSLASGGGRVAAAFITYLLYEASYTMFNIPYGSLLSAMADNDAERAKLSSARGFGSIIGTLIPMVLFPVIIDNTKNSPQGGYAAGVTLCAAIGLAACLLCCRWSKERGAGTAELQKDSGEIRLSDILVVVRKNRAFDALCIQGLCYCISQYMVNTLGIYMFRDVLGSLSMMSVMTVLMVAANVVALLIAPKTAEKIGLEKTVRLAQLIGIALMLLDFIVAVFSANVIAYMALTALASCFTGLTVLMQWGMVGEAIDYNELLTGKRTEGSIYGTFNLMRRIGQALGSALAVGLLGMTGYVPNAQAQTPGVIFGIKILVILVPAAFVFLCWIALKFVWNITPQIRVEIAEYKGNGV